MLACRDVSLDAGKGKRARGQGETEDVGKITEEAEGDESGSRGGRTVLGKGSRKEKTNGHF